MIIKLREPVQWSQFRANQRLIKAKRFDEDFLYETRYGWIQGYRGQWLLELGEQARVHLDHEAFMRAYKPSQAAG